MRKVGKVRKLSFFGEGLGEGLGEGFCEGLFGKIVKLYVTI
jgi:hypothetical protein